MNTIIKKEIRKTSLLNKIRKVLKESEEKINSDMDVKMATIKIISNTFIQ